MTREKHKQATRVRRPGLVGWTPFASYAAALRWMTDQGGDFEVSREDGSEFVLGFPLPEAPKDTVIQRDGFKEYRLHLTPTGYQNRRLPRNLRA